jgi:benzoyl-CoA-dihydrodiol lyase
MTTPLSFDTHPEKYKHWKLAVEGELATLTMDVDPHGGLKPGYELKLNSYDLGVDIELADAVQRLRFEHPGVRCVIVQSGNDRVFCAGANIPMLGGSTHAWKVNFCKFTNETRLSIEDASAHSGQKYLAAVAGPCAGGGYELALACDEILLVDDGASTVSLPEVPLLGVLPGTGGLTRLVDKRRVRRDRADVFCTTSEGIRGKRAVEWRLVDAITPKSRFAEAKKERALALAARSAGQVKGPGITLDPAAPEVDGDTLRYRHVTLAIDRAQRRATITIAGPTGPQPKTADEIQAAGAAQWSLRAFRELDDAILRLRHEHLSVGLVVLQTRGDLEAVRAVDEALYACREHWLANEILALQAARPHLALDLRDHRRGLLLRGLALRGRALGGPHLHARRRRGRGGGRALVAECGRAADAARPLAPRDALPARARAGRARAREARTHPHDGRRRTRSRHRRAGRDRLGGRRAHRARGAREPLARRALRHGGEPALRGPGERRQQDLRAALGLAELDLPAPERRGPAGRADEVRAARSPHVRLDALLMAEAPRRSG